MKFKKLILSGFKSFADRTEFDFHDGVSAVVGPNGCGKSNIVDAIKWVLGEQSAKSLRGSEMMDVIFNGSAARKQSACAEVTLVFDNADGALQPAPGETAASASVSVTRRLYRSGASEYLINKAVCRLRDIREMFMDTGVGTDAYSVIEQGRVELFLQASHEDRRAIFDEAAGISKYKARKKEALRKLERVEQNLLRLADILGEVEKRLRSIKYQAGKARNYQQYHDQLRSLRSLHFLAQFHSLTHQRTDLQGLLAVSGDNLASLTSKIEQFEAARNAAEAESGDIERAQRELQGQLASVSAQISTGQQRADMLAARVTELGDQIVAAARRGEELEAQIETARATMADRTAELRRIDEQAGELSSQHRSVGDEHAAGELGITQLAGRLEDEKAGTIELLRRTSQLHNEIHGLTVRQESLHNQKDRLAGRVKEIEQSLQGTLVEHGQYQVKLADVQSVLRDAAAKLEETRQATRAASDGEQDLRNQIAAHREQRSAILSRIDVLTKMQARLEGVAAGVKKVLQARQEGKLSAIRGMLGEFLTTDVQHAPIVQAALAGADQQLLADRLADVQLAQNDLSAVLGDGGAVEVLCLDRFGPHRDDFFAAGHAKVLGRVIDYVTFEADLERAMWRLLGKTLVVVSLADAAEVAAVAPADYRFVTITGEVLEADGRVRLGSANLGAGIITRRSELAELETQRLAVEARIDDLGKLCQTAKTHREHLEEVQQKLRTALYEANTEKAECQSRIRRLDETIEQLQKEKPLVAGDIANLVRDIDAAVADEHQHREKAAELEQLSQERQKQTAEIEQQIAAARSRLSELTGKMTELKVALAQAEQKKLAVRDALAALNRQHEQMQQELAATRSEIDLMRQRRNDAEAAIAASKQDVERLQARQAELQGEAAELAESRQSLQQRLEDIRQHLAAHRKTQEQAGAELNELKMKASQTDLRIENLITRSSDEMGMNLPELYPTYQHDENRDWNAVEAEIGELKGKIERLGNVNLDAITEQDELENRQKFLATQLEDIRTSQNQLTELIRRINKESRDMFLESFEAIRGNFQDLFRKLFGGGKADIMLIDSQDVLESGIEIVARPPGKETRSLSLLSGGEKTMTALALLFSIFKSRPSPFCLLDEVDAALDEANNNRFNRLVLEFVAMSQFIIITHAKRTMSMADVLYGVTMQEPGVSRRISVKFEDVGKKLDDQLQPA